MRERYSNEYDEFKYEILSTDEDGAIKQLYWNIAFGLQDVDRLKPSKYMISLAKENTLGKITYGEVEDSLNTYYRETKKINYDEKEADEVSLRIFKLLNDQSFRFEYNTLRLYHKVLFDGVELGISSKYIGQFRDYNISKKEPILNGDTVIYSDFRMIKDTLDFDFSNEKMIDYRRMSYEQIVVHLADFTSHIWQVHPFGEGNTRTTAVFIQKYINSLHLGKMDNEIFKDNSLYFRNALVRANYSNYAMGISEDASYLRKFFSNLLLGTQNELDNEELFIDNALNRENEFHF